ncbi:MAG TPA: hypothetical protein VJ552_13895 [Sediminibacterium sp.]|nr:hypothetical protein [Sediminibacterium sp.]
MKQSFNYFFCRYWDAFLASAIVVIWILLYARHGGIGVSPDSVAYLSAADNLVNGFSFTDYNNLPFVLFPLGYPVFLALVQLFSPGTLIHTAPILNGLLYSGLLFMSSYLFRQMRFYHPAARLLLLLFLTTSSALLEVYSMLWSETLFLLLVLLFFIALHRYLLSLQQRDLLMAAIIVSLVFVVRYAGITCVMTGCLLILFNERLTGKMKLKHLLVFGTVGIALAAGNLVRNSLLSGTFTGVRQKATRTFTENLQDAGEVLRYWFPLPESVPAWTLVTGALILLIALLYVLYSVLQQQYFSGTEHIIALFVLIYTAFMLTISTVSRFETLSSRLLSPAYIPVILLLATGSVYLVQRKRQLPKMLILLLLLCTYGYAQYRHYSNNSYTWEGVSYAGIPGYTEDQWKKSPLIAHMKNKEKEFSGTIFSNANDALFFLSGIRAFPLPHKDIPEEIRAFRQNKSFFLVWFFNGENPDLVGLEYIQQHYPIKASWQFKDGIIFSF